MFIANPQQAKAFGAALTALALTETPASAAILTLTPNPPVLPIQGPIGGLFIDLQQTATGGPGSFYQYNDNRGKSLRSGPGGFNWLQVAYGAPITTGLPFVNFVYNTFFAAGTATFAFLTPANQVGWLRMNFGGIGGPVTYLGAAWNNTPGGDIDAGVSVPEPSSLALAGLAALALGAGYVRKRRKALTAN